MSKPRKHPLAVAWERWIESDDGKRCLELPTERFYLQNRLWRAFMAGADAARDPGGPSEGEPRE